MSNKVCQNGLSPHGVVNETKPQKAEYREKWANELFLGNFFKFNKVRIV